jgi:NitT/TauT family transport system ATP-binding protein
VASEAPLTYSSKDAVVCRGVGKTWAAGTKRAHEALREVDLDVAPGEFVVFLGPSGCGKSTLLYLIAGLEDATEGQIWSFRDPVTAPSPEQEALTVPA